MKYLVVGNWKMNPPTWREAKQLFAATQKAAKASLKVAVVVAPPAIFLRELKASYHGRLISFALQNAYWEGSGAHTGETSLVQGKDAGASFVIVGHAERRGLGETDEDTGKKVAAAVALKMTPILCVGEKVRGVDGEHFALVKNQLRAGFSGVEPWQVKSVIVTYEPLWTIGGTKTMSPRDMHEMAIFIRKSLVELKGEQGMNLRILYGGSIDASNADAMLLDGDVYGLLVGRASENGEKLTELLQAIQNA